MVHKFRIEILQYSQKIALKIHISTRLILLIELILSFILLVQQASPIAGTHLCLSMPAWVHTCLGIKTVLISTINVINSYRASCIPPIWLKFNREYWRYHCYAIEVLFLPGVYLISNTLLVFGRLTLLSLFCRVSLFISVIH